MIDLKTVEGRKAALALCAEIQADMVKVLQETLTKSSVIRYGGFRDMYDPVEAVFIETHPSGDLAITYTSDYTSDIDLDAYIDPENYLDSIKEEVAAKKLYEAALADRNEAKKKEERKALYEELQKEFDNTTS